MSKNKMMSPFMKAMEECKEPGISGEEFSSRLNEKMVEVAKDYPIYGNFWKPINKE